jgi:ubiquinone/menaquinone biosynthesis C-methylase UbiE
VSAPPLTPLAAAVLHVPSPERALVVGCGDGEAALFVAREFPSARVRGVDRSAPLVREASARIGLDPEGRVAFKIGKASALPFPDDLFDLVAQVEGWVWPGELARVLRPGGHLILTRPASEGLFTETRDSLRFARLANRGFVPLRSEHVGDGNFTVARLAEAR